MRASQPDVDRADLAKPRHREGARNLSKEILYLAQRLPFSAVHAIARMRFSCAFFAVASASSSKSSIICPLPRR
eukprot:6520213-Pyramimonas_sp.AAC.1